MTAPFDKGFDGSLPDFSNDPRNNTLDAETDATSQDFKAQPPKPTPAPSRNPSVEEQVERARNFFGLGKWVYKMSGVESSDNNNAVSVKGARGRWQVMPDTFRGLNEQYNRESGTNETWNINNPAQNAFAAMYLLSNNMRRFKKFADNDRHLVSLAIAGYHGNADALEQWLSKNPDNRYKVAPAKWNDGHISTRDHVYKVMQDVGDGDIRD